MSRSSPEALAALGLRPPPERRAIPGQGAQSVAAILDTPTPADRAALPGLDERRRDIIVAGALLLEQIVEGLA